MPPWDLRRPFFAVTLLMSFNLFPIINAIDTITKTQFISDSKNEAIVSSNGKFKLGFFSSGNSLGRYVGIWYNKVSKYTVVWVANRENPLKNSTGIFKISGDGNLAVFDSNVHTPLWSTNMSMPSAPTSAKLLDSGNLVLVARNEYRNTESIIWQSFDYPTDTVLPGMKFGLDQKTGLNRILTSWKSSDDPAQGDYSFGLDPHGSLQYFLNKDSAPYWRGGPWNGRTLNGVPEIMTRLKNNEVDFSNEVYLFNYSYVHNHEETYIIFNVTINSIFSTLMVDADGTLNRLIWKENSLEWVFRIEPEDMCDEYASCGKYAICNFNNAMKCACLPGFKPRAPKDLPLECVEKRKFQCGKGAGEGFVKLARVKIPDTSTARVYGNLSLQECKMECLRKCNCSGYASTDINEGGIGCLAWFGELNDMQQYTEEGQDFYLRLNAMDLAAYERKNSKAFLGTKRMDMVVMLSITLAVLLLMSSCYILRRKHAARKGHKERQRRREILLMESKSSLMSFKDSTNANECENSINVELTFFDLGTIMDATENFSSDNKLGQGGFGPVYKGQLHNGQEIAIKRLSKNSGQGIVEFKNEVLLIAKLQHRNLVRLVGCCIEEEEKMLIYEYMPNKSLDYFLFDQKRKALLDWEKRFEIILGIARGILYLHQDSRLRIIHRDLKTSNILLDGEMKPKISDFGTARIFGGNQSRAKTCRVVGTFGYMSPEYVLCGLFSMKSDVFSFGVIVLEIISGQKVGYFKETSKNLIQHAWDVWSDGKALEMVDSSISDSCPALEVLQCIQVGLLCVQDIAEDRPTMSNVVFMLSNETTLPSPKQPTFATIRNQIDPISFTMGTNSCSVNEVTVTTLDAR